MFLTNIYNWNYWSVHIIMDSKLCLIEIKASFFIKYVIVHVGLKVKDNNYKVLKV